MIKTVNNKKDYVDSPWISAGLGLSLAGIIGGLLGYIFQILMGRWLPADQFILLATLMALLGFLSAPLGALTMFISRWIASAIALGSTKNLRHVFWRYHRRVLFIFLVLSPLLFVFMGPIKVFLKSTVNAPILLTVILLLCASLGAINAGFLQGFRSYVFLGLGGTLAATLKIILPGMIYLVFGLNVSLVIVSLIAIALIIFTCGALLILSVIKQSEMNSEREHSESFTGSFWMVLLANLGFAGMTQLDVALVNNFFSTELASSYAAAAVLGKAVLYLPGGLVLALFPVVAANKARRYDSKNIILYASIVTLILCGVAALFYLLVGDWVITLFFADKYPYAGEVLKIYGFAVLPLALVYVAENYLIARGEVLFVWLFLAVAPLQILMIYFFHTSLEQIVLIIGVGGLIVASIGYLLLNRGLANGIRAV